MGYHSIHKTASNMKKALKLIALFAYIGAVILASAGAMNYAHETSQTIYTVAGIVNILLGAWNVYKVTITTNIL